MFAAFSDNPEKTLENIMSPGASNMRLHHHYSNKKKTNSNSDDASIKEMMIQEERDEMKLESIYVSQGKYTREEIDAVINALSKDEYEFLVYRYGGNIEQPVPRELTIEEKNRFYGGLLPKIRNDLKRNRDIAEHPEDYTENGIKRRKPRKITPVQEPVQVEEVRTYKEPVKQEVAPFEGNYDPIKEDVTQAPVKEEKEEMLIVKDDAVKLLELMRTPSYNELTSSFSPKDAIIIGLKLGYVDGKYFSTEAIANFLGESEDTVRESTQKVLLAYKDHLMSTLDSVIEVATDKKKALTIGTKENK